MNFGQQELTMKRLSATIVAAIAFIGPAEAGNIYVAVSDASQLSFLLDATGACT